MKVLLTWVLVLTTQCVSAQNEEVRVKTYNIKKGLALEGYDPVSYFDGTPVEGDGSIKAIYKGVQYRFANRQNEKKFTINPEKYEPAYGGWCAYAMGESGEKVKVDPETYKIIDGRLYLFYNFWGSNTLTDWNKNEKKLKSAGDLNWNKIIR